MLFNAKFTEQGGEFRAEIASGAGGSGTTDHTQLTNRDAADQHPMSAITGLTEFVNGNKSIPIINNGDDITNLNGVYYFDCVEIPRNDGYTDEIYGIVTCKPGFIWSEYTNARYLYVVENQTWSKDEIYLWSNSEIDYNNLINTPCGLADNDVLISDFECSGTSPSQSTPFGVDLGIVDGDTFHICGVVWNDTKTIEFDDVYIAESGYITITPYGNTGSPVLMIDITNNSVMVFAVNSSLETTVAFDFITKTDVSKLNEIYIPDTIARTDDIPEWAKQADKPTYTAAEVGALPADTEIPDAYTLPVATSDILGGVKPAAKTAAMTQEVGIDETGRLYTAQGGGTYTLPAATADTLGGVKIGSGITAADDGTISVSGGGSASLPVVYETTLSEAVSTVQIGADAEGNALSLTEMECYVSIPNTTTAAYDIYQYLSIDKIMGAKITTVANDATSGVGCVTRYTAGSGYIHYTILKYYTPKHGDDYYYDTRTNSKIDVISPITFVKLTTYSESNTIPVGTKIVIRGR